MATDYSLVPPLRGTGIWSQIRASELLEDATIRHCLAGDVVAQALGSDVVTGDLFIAVADTQLETAKCILLSGGFYSAISTYYRASHTSEDWPGFSFRNDPNDQCCVKLVPASFWHLDLEPESYSDNTVLLPESRVRFPNKLHYFDATIHVITDRYPSPDLNSRVTHYFILQASYLEAIMPKPLVAQLPPEDTLFLELFDKIMLPSARNKLCLEYQKIRSGQATVEEARSRIPRKDIGFAKLKAEMEARKSRIGGKDNLQSP